MSCCIRLRLICRLDKREEEGAVSGVLVIRRRMRENGLWRRSANFLSLGETHCSRVAQRGRWIRGRLIMREKIWCTRVKRHQRGSAVITCGGTTNR